MRNLFGFGCILAGIVLFFVLGRRYNAYFSAAEKYEVTAYFSEESSWNYSDDEGYEAVWEYYLGGSRYTFTTMENSKPWSVATRTVLLYIDKDDYLIMVSDDGYLGMLGSYGIPLLFFAGGIIVVVAEEKQRKKNARIENQGLIYGIMRGKLFSVHAWYNYVSIPENRVK